MKRQDFTCYTKNNNVLSIGMNLNNIISKHYYSENVMKGGGFRKNLNIPLPLMLLNHENSFLKKTIVDNTQTGGDKQSNKNSKKDEVISDSLFDKLIDLKSKTNLKKTRKRGGKRNKKKTKKLFIF